MKKKQTTICVNPEEKVCPLFDATGTKLFLKPDTQKNITQVLDNCAEEHIQ